MPGDCSTPLDTSTPKGCTCGDGGGDVVGRQAAGEDELDAARELHAAADQSAGTPVPLTGPSNSSLVGSGFGSGCAGAQHGEQLERRAGGAGREVFGIGLQDVGLEHGEDLVDRALRRDDCVTATHAHPAACGSCELRRALRA